jgi:hypothetical protein
LVLASAFVFQSAQAGPPGAESFEQTIVRLSSGGTMIPEDGKILKDNRAAFDEKINAIRSAQAGDRIYMMYYIYQNDETTSVVNKELIAAAQRGVKINLMVDFLTNYGNLDLFNVMDRMGKGNFEIGFFNPPTSTIHRDVVYMTTNCLGVSAQACKEKKKQLVDEAIAKDVAEKGGTHHLVGPGHFFSRLFLAGLGAKHPGALQLAVTEGGTLPAQDPNAEKLSEEQKKGLLDYAKILLGAKVFDHPTDKIKLVIAMLMHGEQLTPVNQAIENLAPISGRRGEASGQQWEELTQFTHHKLLAVIKANGQSMQLINGGRNMENSYHLNEDMRAMIKKYLFSDTDFSATVRDPEAVKKMERAVYELAEHGNMVMDLKDVNKWLPVDLVKEIAIVQKVIAANKHLKSQEGMDAIKYSEIIEKQVMEEVAQVKEARLRAELANLNKNAEAYRSLREAVVNSGVRSPLPDVTVMLDAKDKDAKIAYLENLPYREKTALESFWGKLRSLFGRPTVDKPRVYTPIAGQEEAFNKNIHAAMIETLKEASRVANAEGQVQKVYIDMGYVFMPSNLVKVIGQMMDGTIDARNIELVIMTNSIETTDLNIMNVLARHQLKAMLEYFEQHRGSERALRNIQIFEQQVLEGGKTTSMHSKAMVTKYNLIKSSANFDVRSFETDTNNGMLILNAEETAKKMSAHYERVIADQKLFRNVTKDYRKNHGLFLAEDGKILEAISAKYKGVGKRIQSAGSDLTTRLMSSMADVYITTGLILDYDGAHEWMGRFSAVRNPELEETERKAREAREALPGAGAGGGGGAVAVKGAAGSCAKAHVNTSAAAGALKASESSKSAAPRLLNTRGEMMEKIEQKRRETPRDKVGPEFDRAQQLI